jgi:hypothetical protein
LGHTNAHKRACVVCVYVFHRAYLEEMITRVFGPSATFLADKLHKGPAASGQGVNMEAAFSQLTLDVIGETTGVHTRTHTHKKKHDDT